MELTTEELRTLWNTWSSDSSLRSTLRFGQFVCNRKIQAGFCWPECYYASTDVAYQMLYDVAAGLKPFSGRRSY